MAELTLEELQQQFNDLKKRVNILEGNPKRKIEVEPKAGNQFELVGLKWKILDVFDLGCMCLAERLESRFDPDTNDWRISELRQHLNGDLLRKLENKIGEGNVIEFERDLLSVDGQNQYRACKDKVSLLTLDEYRKYRSLIPNEGYCWWLLTPWSTGCNGHYSAATIVSQTGLPESCDCSLYYGIRLVCVFSPSIFAEEIKQ